MEQRYSPNDDARINDARINDTRIELTQQQVSFAAAFVLLLSFFAFMAGYFSGNEIEECEMVSIPIALAHVSRAESSVHVSCQSSEGSLRKTYSASLGNYAQKHEAEQLIRELKEHGIPTEICQRESRTVKGDAFFWYTVSIGPVTEKDEFSMLLGKAQLCIRKKNMNV